MPFGSVRNVRKVFGAVVALDDASFTFEAGEFVSLLGPSGCGKTTLLRIVGGLISRTSGSVEIAGKPVERPDGSYGFVFQAASLMPWRSVIDNVLFPMEILRRLDAAARRRAEHLLDLVDLAAFRDARPHQLSGGMQQRVALCRALIHQPPLLLMDEPFSALDELTRFGMNDLLLRVRQETGASVLFVTHSISEAIYLSDKVLVFSRRPARVALTIPVCLPGPRTQQIRFGEPFKQAERLASEALGVVGADGCGRGVNRERFGYPIAGVLLVLAVWALACWLAAIPTVVLPSPGKVALALWRRADLLWSEGWVTLQETLIGFFLALLVGLPLAVLVANARRLNLMVYPLLVALQSVPKVALAPILLVWLGTGLASKLAVVWLVAFFPIIIDTAAGLRATPPALLELAHSLNATRWQILLKVQAPAALPFILTGAKVAITLAVIGAVIAEFVSSTEGLGYLLLSATSQLDTPLAFAALLALSALGLAVYGGVELAERLMAPWLPPK